MNDSPNTLSAALAQSRGGRQARGKLFRGTIESGGGGKRGAAQGDSAPNNSVTGRREDREDPYRLAFGLLFLFTLLLYLRPNDLIPAMGTFPLAKIVAILAPLAYAYAQYRLGRPIINWTTEVKMVFLMLFLAVLFTPIAASPSDSVSLITDIFIKTVIIFVLIINLVNTRARLRSIISLTVICGTWLAIFAIKNYAAGNFELKGERIAGVVGGIFGNPNDLALALNLLIPLAVSLALLGAGRVRQFYIACALIMTVGVIATFSRAGFISLVAMAAVMLWKFGQGKRTNAAIAGLIAAAIMFGALSESYQSRLSSIFDRSKDTTGSAQQRTELLKRGVDLAVRHPIIGLGIGNFHIYSINEKVAHNAYLETAAELGGIGLLAYLILILAPLRGLSRIERGLRKDETRPDLEMKYLSIGLQAVLVTYMVNSFFISIQYLWYLYYAAGYAVALRLIYAAEKAAQASGSVAVEAADQFQTNGKLWETPSRKPAGSLWPAYRFRKGF